MSSVWRVSDCKQWDGEFGDDEYALDSAESGIHRHVVDNRSVNHCMLRPKARNTDRSVRTSSAHFTGPFMMKHPRRNSVKIITPTYTGPFVPSGSPK